MESLNLRTLSNYNHPFLNSPQFSYLHVYPQKRKPTFIHIFPQTPLPTPILLHLRPIQTAYCCLHSPSTSSNTDKLSDANSSIPSEKRFIRNAALIGVGTLTSKILGLVREVILAAVFGAGPVATAFKYASVLPGFAAALIGGVNGPIHITMATTLSKLSKERQRKLFQHTNCIMFLVGGSLAALVFVSAEFIIHIYAPGLWILAEGRMTREIAVAQLRTMIPCIVLAGPVGLGFGFMRRK